MEQALYTEFLDTFLKRHESSQEWANVVAKFNKFPKFSFNGGFDLQLDFYQLFLEKYRFREIGAETEQMFYFYLNNTLNELAIKYVPKINLYLENMMKSCDRKQLLKTNGDSQNLLYPITSENGKIATGVQYKDDKEQALLFFKTNAEMLKYSMQLQDIYLDCLQEFETCFMGVM